ncbi:MAG: hypothetical protein JWP89_5362 [Schlesneria sp.]|nr:hypothetical protein [Schlesneria sp.]
MRGHVMNWRLLGTGCIYFAMALCVTSSFASGASTDEASPAKSPLNEPNDPSIVSSIDRMKRRLTEGQISDRILLRLKLIELEPKQLNKLLMLERPLEAQRWNADQPLAATDTLTWLGLWDFDALRELTHHPEAPIWLPPPMNLIAGCESRYNLGGSIPVRRLTEDGASSSCDETYGRSVVATATISNVNQIRLSVMSEACDLTTSNGVASTDNKRRIDATFEMNHGETRVFGRKVVSSSGRETYQLVQATACLQLGEIPVDSEMIPVSAVDELSTPEQDVAEFKVTSPFRIDSFEPADTKSEPGALQRPNSLAAEDSMLARHLRRIDDNRVADEVLVSIVVTEVTRDDFENDLRLPPRYYYLSGPWNPNFLWSFATDVVEVEVLGDPSMSPPQSTEFDCSEWSSRICRPNRWGSYRSGKTWKMPTTIAASGNTLVWQSGGMVPVVRLDQYRRESIASEQFGLTVSATPTITDDDEIQLHLDISLKDLVEDAMSLRVQSARRMQASVRVRNGEIVTFGQPAVSDTGRESFISFSVIASSVSSNHEPAVGDGEAISALVLENSEPTHNIPSLNINSAKPFEIGNGPVCWADSIPQNSKEINNILEALYRHRPLQPDAEVGRLSYRLSHPFDESSQLFADP